MMNAVVGLVLLPILLAVMWLAIAGFAHVREWWYR